jgi:hypothetical protein
MHSIEYNYGNESFAEYWPLNNVRNVNYELHNDNQRNVNRINYVSLENYPLFKFPKVWNELPMELTSTLFEELLNEQ